MSNLSGINASACPIATERLYLLARVEQLRHEIGIMKARKFVAQKFKNGQYDLKYIKRLSWQTLARWQEQKLSLSPQHKNAGRKGTLCEDQLYKIISLKTQNPHLTWEMIAAKVHDEDGIIPEKDTVRRAFQGFKEKHPDQISRLTNPAEWRNKYRMAMGNASAMATHVNALWELDSTPMDCKGADGERYALMGGIDVYSRTPWVKVAKTSNSVGIKCLIRRGFLEMGIPDIIKTDNGKDYKSREVQAAIIAIGAEQRFCNPRSPWEKPHIERFLGKLNHGLSVTLPDFLGHSVQDQVARREREAAKKKEPNKAINKLSRFFGVCVNAGLSISELQAIIDEWCELQMDRPHKGLDGNTPRMMLSGAKISKVNDVRILDILLSDLGGKNGVRTIQRNGISVDNGYFIHHDIAKYVGQKVRIKHDPAEEKYMHVFDLQWNFLFTAYNKKMDGYRRKETAQKGHVIQARENKLVDNIISDLQKQKRKIKNTDYAAKIRKEANLQPDNVVFMPMQVDNYTPTSAVGLQDAIKEQPAEATPEQMYARWCSLDGLNQQGKLPEEERAFYASFPKTKKFKVQARKNQRKQA